MNDNASVPYAPIVTELCGDPECCPFGFYEVTCRTCRREWPCDDFRMAHGAGEVERQERWAKRTESPEFADLYPKRDKK